MFGENGAGKSTLMNIIAGLYPPDSGSISVHGEQVYFSNPRQAIAKGIGMVFQHFMLVQNHTVAENIILGAPGNGSLNLREVNRQIGEISARYDLVVDPEKKIRELSVGEQQRVEIVKVLFRGADILILDEPTAVLTPQESRSLYRIMEKMASEKHSIIFISHKMKEVVSLSHRITVLNRGKVMATLKREETNAGNLAALMLGNIPENETDLRPEELVREEEAAAGSQPLQQSGISPPPSGSRAVVQLQNINAHDDRGHPVLKGVSLDLCPGEILGLAGISGNGQPELAEVLSGLRAFTRGVYNFEGRSLKHPTVNEMIEHGVGYIPEDRKTYGVSSGLSIAFNFLLRDLENPDFFWNRLIRQDRILQYGKNKMQEFDVRAPSEKTPVGSLSGGNMQKVILARETSRPLKLLLACQPTRGLDIHATRFIREAIRKSRDAGLAVLWISEDLDELMLMANRIAVIFNGRIVDTMDCEKATVEQIGRMMTGMSGNSRNSGQSNS